MDINAFDCCFFMNFFLKFLPLKNTNVQAKCTIFIVIVITIDNTAFFEEILI